MQLHEYLRVVADLVEKASDNKDLVEVVRLATVVKGVTEDTIKSLGR